MQMVAFLREHGHSGADVPIVVGGDFNSLWRKYRSDPFDEVRSASHCPACQGNDATSAWLEPDGDMFL